MEVTKRESVTKEARPSLPRLILEGKKEGWAGIVRNTKRMA